MTSDVALVSHFVCFNLNTDFSNAANAVKTFVAFVGAADKNAILTSYDSDADVCIQEFEDFCLPELRRS